MYLHFDIIHSIYKFNTLQKLGCESAVQPFNVLIYKLVVVLVNFNKLLIIVF